MRILETAARDLAAMALAVGGFLPAYVAAVMLCPSREVLLRWTAAMAALLWIAAASFHMLSAAHLFALLPALGLATVLSYGALRWVGGAEPLRRSLRRDAVFASRVMARVTRSRHRWLVLAFVAAAAPGLLHALLVPPLAWDTLTYHGLKAGMWVHNHGPDAMVGPGPWAYYRNMLGGGEVFWAWAMLPLHSDTLAPAADVFEWAALGVVMLALARRVRLREPFASAAAGFVLAVPTVRLLIGSGYVEIAGLLALTAGLTLALEALRSQRGGLLVLASAALGVAASTKLPTILLAGAVLLVLFLGLIRRVRWTSVAMAAAVFTIALAPWLAQNVVRTGLPFSPLPVKAGDLTLGQPSPELQWYMERPRFSSTLQNELAALNKVFRPPLVRNEGLGLLTLLVLTMSVPGLRPLATRAPAGMFLVGLAVLINLGSYYAPGFSIVRLNWSVSSSRFLLPLVALLTLVSVAWCRRRTRSSSVYLHFLRGAALFNLLMHSFDGFSGASLKGAAILLAGLIGLGTMGLGLSRRIRPALVWPVVFLVGLLGLQPLRDALRADLFRNDFVLHPVPNYWTPALAHIDTPDVPHRIAITSAPYQYLDNWFAAPFLGRALQNDLVYVPISADGGIPSFGDVRNNSHLRQTASVDAWLQRLHQGHVTEVMSFTPPSIELEWMEGHPERFDRLAGDPHRWGLFRVK